MKRAVPSTRVRRVPLGDGGEGTVRALAKALGAALLFKTVRGPLGAPTRARWGWAARRRLALSEMAEASGLTLVPPGRRDPFKTSTAGTGELIRAALDRGAREIILGIGGSATVDGGLGMAQALGARFFSHEGEIAAPAAGRDLLRLRRMDLSGLDRRLARARVRAACDVDNPLFGKRGAAFVYAPQKGATPRQARELDAGLRNLARVIRRDLGVDVSRLPGAGAAGGLGAGLAAFLGARLEPGIHLVLRTLGMEENVRWADLILTGEGRVDGPSARGKTPAGLARLARRWRKPLVVLAGSKGPGAEELLGLGAAAVIAVGRGLSRRESIRRAPELLAREAGRLARAYSVML